MTIRQALLSLPLIIAGWIGTLAAVLWMGGTAPAAMVILPRADLLSRLPDGISVVDTGRFSITLRGDAALVTALYIAGARLVLPAELTNCLSGQPGPAG